MLTAFNKLGIEFDELSASEKLQHILDITPVVKTKKLSPASVVEIERLTDSAPATCISTSYRSSPL